MANRKELPREKKLKLKVGELEDLLITKELDIESLQKEVTELLLIKNNLSKDIEGMRSELNSHRDMENNYRKQFTRDKKLIDFLIDPKL